MSAVNKLFESLHYWRKAKSDHLLYSFLDIHGDEIEAHTYASFCSRYESIAAYLCQLPGVQAGDRIILLFPHGLELICSIFACVRAGLIPVPTSLPSGNQSQASFHRLSGIIHNCQPSHLLLNSTSYQELNQCHDSLLNQLTPQFAQLLSNYFINTDEIQNLPLNDCNEILSVIVPSNTFLIQYTSGSTSDPKGVIISAENVLTNASSVVDHESPICVSWLPQHHDMGLFGYYVYIALHGGTTYGFSPRSFVERPLLWLETITKYQATATSVPNFALELCLIKRKVPDSSLSKLNLTSLKFLMIAAEPVNSQTFYKFIERYRPTGLNEHSIFAAYGLAEFTLAATNYGRNSISLAVSELSQGRAVECDENIDDSVSIFNCGYALNGTEIIIVNPDTSIRCKDTFVGEVWLNGKSKAMGYWNLGLDEVNIFNASLKDSSTTQSYLRTGDMGFIKDKCLYICGRYKEMIIIRGKNYFPQDIEKVVYDACSDLKIRSVVAFDYNINNQVHLALVIETKSNKPELHKFRILSLVRQKIGLHVDVITFVPIKTIPKTTSGKIMRVETKKRWLNKQFDEITSISSSADNQDVNITLSSAEDLSSFLLMLEGLYDQKDINEVFISDLGLDSIDIVSLLVLIKDELNKYKLNSLSDKINIGILQMLTVNNLKLLINDVKTDSLDCGDFTNLITERISSLLDEKLLNEHSVMSKDRLLYKNDLFVSTETKKDILLTGGTGFLGPFIIKSLLHQSENNQRIKVIVRSNNHDSGFKRLRKTFITASGNDKDLISQFDSRIDVISGDISSERFNLSEDEYNTLTQSISTIYHNGALVNYLMSYGSMRGANVLGTHRLLNLAHEAGISDFNYISTTFIFGWSTTPELFETDNNEQMNALNFGYSQSKWVAEQVVIAAQEAGLPVRIYRPALISPTTKGLGNGLDISLRLLLFMIKHRITVTARNQVSFLPVDLVANNVVAFSSQQETVGRTYHVVQDKCHTMADVTDEIEKLLDIKFTRLELDEFIARIISLCKITDPLYPLLDFIIYSEGHIRAMEYKKYNSDSYQETRKMIVMSRDDPSLTQIVKGILTSLAKHDHFIKQQISNN